MYTNSGWQHLISSCLQLCGVSTLCLKKVPTFKLFVTLSNLNRFSKFLHCCRMMHVHKFEFLISLGSVATRIRWGGYCRMGFVANFIRFPAMHKMWTSVEIWQSYREYKAWNFFETQCSIKYSMVLSSRVRHSDASVVTIHTVIDVTLYVIRRVFNR